MTPGRLIANGLRLMGLSALVFLLVGFGLAIILVVESLSLLCAIFNLPARLLMRRGR